MPTAHLPIPAVLLAGCAIFALSGCPGGDCADYDDVEAWIELGTGSNGFEEMNDATILSLAYGMQGGAHFWGSIRFDGFLAGYDGPLAPAPIGDDGGTAVTGRERPILALSLLQDHEDDLDGEDGETIASYGPTEVQPDGNEVFGVTMRVDSYDWEDLTGGGEWWEEERARIESGRLRYVATFTDVCGTTVRTETTAKVRF
jgi:hypothetical protein